MAIPFEIVTTALVASSPIGIALGAFIVNEITNRNKRKKKQKEEDEKERARSFKIRHNRKIARQKKRREEPDEYLKDELEEFDNHLSRYYPRLRDVAEEMTGHVEFTKEKKFAGYVKCDQKFVGIDVEEVSYPTDTFRVRPIRDQSEWNLLLSSEKCLPANILRSRVLSGEALVSVPVLETPVYEDIFEPSYKFVEKAVYLLWDVSPSMSPRYCSWRKPVWSAINVSILRKARRHNVPLYYRQFGNAISSKYEILNTIDAIDFVDKIANTRYLDGTNIVKALYTAIKDMKDSEYEKGHIVIVTDGEHNDSTGDDERFKRIREQLEDSKIKLHSLMIGAKNSRLQSISDVYQIVNEKHNLSQCFKRKSDAKEESQE